VRRVAAAVVGLVLLGGLAALDWLVFRAWFDSDYLRWYLKNGALIAIVFGLVTLAWGDLNKVTGLVSAHPLEYLASCLVLGTLPSLAFSGSTRVWAVASPRPGPGIASRRMKSTSRKRSSRTPCRRAQPSQDSPPSP
jgi:hypothetical protein